MLNFFVGRNLYTSLLLLFAMAFVLFYISIKGFHETDNAVAAVIYTLAMPTHLSVVLAAYFKPLTTALAVAVL